MMQAVRKVVHEGAKPAEAHDLYLTLKKNEKGIGS
jgi:hypothetical protein